MNNNIVEKQGKTINTWKLLKQISAVVCIILIGFIISKNSSTSNINKSASYTIFEYNGARYIPYNAISNIEYNYYISKYQLTESVDKTDIGSYLGDYSGSKLYKYNKLPENTYDTVLILQGKEGYQYYIFSCFQNEPDNINDLFELYGLKNDASIDCISLYKDELEGINLPEVYKQIASRERLNKILTVLRNAESLTDTALQDLYYDIYYEFYSDGLYKDSNDSFLYKNNQVQEEAVNLWTKDNIWLSLELSNGLYLQLTYNSSYGIITNGSTCNSILHSNNTSFKLLLLGEE